MRILTFHDKQKIQVSSYISKPHRKEDLHKAIENDREKRGDHREFTIKSKWTQAIRSSWPPPPNITNEPAFLEEEHTIEENPLTDVVWQWERTQYSTEDWVETKTPGNYIVTFDDENKVTGKVSCNTMKASYQLGTNLLNILKISSSRAACKNPDLDAAFIGDLNRVINFEIIEDRLVLQLNNNAGLMYFNKTKK